MTNPIDTLDIYEEHEGLRAISPAKVLKIAQENELLRSNCAAQSREIDAQVEEIQHLRGHEPSVMECTDCGSQRIERKSIAQKSEANEPAASLGNVIDEAVRKLGETPSNVWEELRQDLAIYGFSASRRKADGTIERLAPEEWSFLAKPVRTSGA